jgi:hypothetical protein
LRSAFALCVVGSVACGSAVSDQSRVVAGNCFSVLAERHIDDENSSEPWIYDWITRAPLDVLFEATTPKDTTGYAQIRPLERGRGYDLGRWIQPTEDSLTLVWGVWADIFVMETAWSSSAFVGNAFYIDDVGCWEGPSEPYCWRGTATIRPVDCPLGGVASLILSPRRQAL